MEEKMKKTTIVLSLLVLTFAATLLYAAGSGDLIVTNQLGVGTTTPNYAVDVVGDVNITGNYRVNGAILQIVTLTGAVSGLTITNDATYPNTMIDVTANAIGTVVPSGEMSIDCTTSDQAAGDDLDTGTLAASTWYYIWAIYNGTTMAGLASTSATSPLMPANYANAAKRLIGVAITDTTAHFKVFAQHGSHWIYDQYQAASTGTTVQSWTAQNCAAYIPPISTFGYLQVTQHITSGTSTASLRKNGSSSTTGHFMGTVSYGGYSSYSVCNDWIVTDSNQRVQLNVTAADTWSLNVLGFELNL